MRSDSDFCDTTCQTLTAERINLRYADRPMKKKVTRRVGASVKVVRDDEDYKVDEKPWVFNPQDDWDEKWAKYRKLVRMKD